MGRTRSEIVCDRSAGFAGGRVPLTFPAFFFLPGPVESTPSGLASAESPAEAPLLSN